MRTKDRQKLTVLSRRRPRSSNTWRDAAVVACCALATSAQLLLAQSLPVPAYSSRPGAAYTLYLNFGGFSYPGTWSGKTPGVVPAYDIDSNPSAFSNTELNNIREIWARVSERYVFLNVNVTTVDPAVAAGQSGNDTLRKNYYDTTPRVMQTIIGGSNSWYNAGAGGVSFRGIIASSQPVGTGYHTNWAFPPNLGLDNKSIAEAVTHENGHAFGLFHQGDWFGPYSNDYSTNNDVSGNGSFAPTMGVTYYSQRGLWRTGRISTTSTQNDLSVIGANSGMTLITTSTAHTMSAAADLPLNADRTVASNTAKGMITPTILFSPNPIGVDNYTKDYYRFFSTGASVTLRLIAGSQNITPGTADPGATFDGTLKIYNQFGALVATATRSTDTLSNTYTGSLPAGNYYVEIASIGGYTSTFDTEARYFTAGSYLLNGSGVYLRSTLAGVNLSNASLISQDLRSANLATANLTSVNFTNANLTSAILTSANLSFATLTSANLTAANIRNANLSNTTSRGFTLTQLYSTASYQARDLTGIVLASNNLTSANLDSSNLTFANFAFVNLTSSNFTSANLTSANLTAANFTAATLTSANFTGADVRSATLTSTTARGFTLAQLYSTASYLTKNLTGIGLQSNNLTTANFASVNLTSANLSGSTLTSADFTGAIVRSANLSAATSNGFTLAQLYSTASYQSKDLTGIVLSSSSLGSANFASANLTSANLTLATLTSANLISANLSGSTLTSADFTGAVVLYANFNATTSTGFTLTQLYSTASYQAKDFTGIALTSNNLASANFTSVNLASANLTSATLTSANFTFADLRQSTGFAPVSNTRVRGTILSDGTINLFAFLTGETLRIRPSPIVAKSVGTISRLSGATASIAVDAGASISFEPVAQSSSNVRTLDTIGLALTGTNGQIATARSTTITATAGAPRTLRPTLTVLTSLSITNDNSPLGSRQYFGLLDFGTNDAIFRSATLADLTDMARAFLTSGGATGLGSSSTIPYTRLAVFPNDVGAFTGEASQAGIAYFTTFDGVGVSATDRLARFTYTADLNIDGVVDGSDYRRFSEGLFFGLTGYQWGDLNYDGVVNSTDAAVFYPAYAATVGSVSLGSPADESSSSAVIPEPTSVVSLLVVPLLCRRVRR